MTSIHKKGYRDIINRLIKARKDAGLTQVEVAEKIGQHQSFVSKIENFDRRLDILELKTLADLYKIEVSELLK